MMSVICCPNCFSPYEVGPGAHATLRLCDHCDTYFTPAITTPAACGDAVLMDDPLIPRVNFLMEAASTMATNVEAVFRLARVPFTQESLMLFVANLPRSLEESTRDEFWRGGHCGDVLLRADRTCREGYADPAQARRLFDYFLTHFPERKQAARDMLIGAFAGVLSVPFDDPDPAPTFSGLTVPARAKPRWWARFRQKLI